MHGLVAVNHVVASPRGVKKTLPDTSASTFPAFLGTYVVKNLTPTDRCVGIFLSFLSFPPPLLSQTIPPSKCCRFEGQKIPALCKKQGFVSVEIVRTGFDTYGVKPKGKDESNYLHYDPRAETVATFQGDNLLNYYFGARNGGIFTDEKTIVYNQKDGRIDLHINIHISQKGCGYSGDAFMEKRAHACDHSTRFFLTGWLSQQKVPNLPAPKLGPESQKYFLETLRAPARAQFDQESQSGLLRRTSFLGKPFTISWDDNDDFPAAAAVPSSSSFSSSSSTTPSVAAAAASSSSSSSSSSAPLAPTSPNAFLSPEMRKKGSKFIERQDQHSLFSLLESLRPDPKSPMAPTPKGLVCDLLPFQRQALHWMVEKEKFETVQSLHPMWDQIELPTNPRTYIYMNKVTGTLSRYYYPSPSCEPGGFLADEMGLGKTVESLALVLAHPRDFSVPDPSRSAEIMAKRNLPPLPIKATLIVAPSALLEQWESECEKHTGANLNVFRFPDPSLTCQPGCQNGRNYCRGCQRWKDFLGECDGNLLTFVAKADIILTTYDSLQKAVRGEHAILLKVQWWRVMLDEAQMVYNTNSTAAIMASELWRVNAWCVSGTPLSNSLQDIHGLMVFLDSDPFADRRALIQCLTGPYEGRKPGSFFDMAGFLSRFMWRHSKAHVEDQIRLPEWSVNPLSPLPLCH